MRLSDRGPWARHGISGKVGAIAAVLACLAATACTTKSIAKDPGSSLAVGLPTDATALDPQTSSSGNTWRVLDVNYETLVGLDDHLQPTPALATGWKQTSSTTYVFDIRRGVKFSNGREMTVDDVVGSLQRLIAPKTASFWAGMLGPISSVTAVGSNQVRVTLAKPRSSFISSLANIPASVLPMKELKAGTFDPSKQVLGTGPYMVISHRLNESWAMVRNPHYWGSPAKTERLTLKIIPDSSAMIAALRTGSVQVATFDSPDTVRLLKGQSNIASVIQKTTNYYELQVNGVSSIFRDDRLRRALALSLDRKKIVDVALGGASEAMPVITPLGLPDSCDPAVTSLAQTDLAQARQLVAAAGARGKTISVMAYDTSTTQIAQVMQRNLQAIGLKVKIETVDPGQVHVRVYTDKADFDTEVNWYGGYNDPTLVTTWWNPTLAQFSKPWMKNDPQLDNLIAQGFTTPIGPARKAVLQQVCNRAATGANMIPLVTRANVIAYRSDQVDPVIAPIDGLAQPLIHVAEFGVK